MILSMLSQYARKDQITIRGTVVKDFEMSRVSQSYTKTVKIPESPKNSLKPDAQRKNELRKLVASQKQ